MEKIIPLFNELQEILYKTNLNHSLQFPQLVVVGAQSTGKSSVLETIIGKDFLPRGTGIVTRRPIVLQLHNVPKDNEEYAEFAHLKGEKFTDWNRVRQEIEAETQKVAGQNKGISAVPIIVKVFSPHVVDLNLVDLPGITKIPVGDQPPDIEQQIRSMIETYVKNPNTIIMAVTAANTDLANSDSLKLAREIDPEGNRTIGIVTKLDLMDEGTDYLDALQGKIYNLRLGYIGVVCRSQKDLDKQKAVKQAIQDERNFFEQHPAYRKYADKLGVPYLIRVLNVTFIQHIKKTLPAIRQNILNLIQMKEYEMSQYGDLGIDLTDKQAKGFLILSLVSKFANAYSEMIKGKYVKTTTIELFGGARIHYIFNDVFKKCIQEMDPFEVLSDDDIRTAIRNANGLRPSLFLPEIAFEILIKQQISRIQEPALECSHLVYEELRKILFHINIPDISRFEVLNARIYEVNFLNKKNLLNIFSRRLWRMY
jgi:dynamin 1-like protein